MEKQLDGNLVRAGVRVLPKLGQLIGVCGGLDSGLGINAASWKTRAMARPTLRQCSTAITGAGPAGEASGVKKAQLPPHTVSPTVDAKDHVLACRCIGVSSPPQVGSSGGKAHCS